MTFASIKRRLAAAKLHLAVEKDATEGHEFTVTTVDGQTIAYGWSGGTKTEAAGEAFQHPAVQLKLARVAS